jgi:hypothetical protein
MIFIPITVVLKGPFLGWRSNYQDNGRLHMAKVAMDALTEVGGTPLEHPSYSPDLVPYDIRLFQPWKGSSEARNLEVINGLQHVFEKWVERCKKCIACQRWYFEKETVTAPPQNSDSE